MLSETGPHDDKVKFEPKCKADLSLTKPVKPKEPIHWVRWHIIKMLIFFAIPGVLIGHGKRKSLDKQKLLVHDSKSHLVMETSEDISSPYDHAHVSSGGNLVSSVFLC